MALCSGRTHHVRLVEGLRVVLTQETPEAAQTELEGVRLCLFYLLCGTTWVGFDPEYT